MSYRKSLIDKVVHSKMLEPLEVIHLQALRRQDIRKQIDKRVARGKTYSTVPFAVSISKESIRSAQVFEGVKLDQYNAYNWAFHQLHLYDDSYSEIVLPCSLLGQDIYDFALILVRLDQFDKPSEVLGCKGYSSYLNTEITFERILSKYVMSYFAVISGLVNILMLNLYIDRLYDPDDLLSMQAFKRLRRSQNRLSIHDVIMESTLLDTMISEAHTVYFNHMKEALKTYRVKPRFGFEGSALSYTISGIEEAIGEVSSVDVY